MEHFLPALGFAFGIIVLLIFGLGTFYYWVSRKSK